MSVTIHQFRVHNSASTKLNAYLKAGEWYKKSESANTRPAAKAISVKVRMRMPAFAAADDLRCVVLERMKTLRARLLKNMARTPRPMLNELNSASVAGAGKERLVLTETLALLVGGHEKSRPMTRRDKGCV